jgi:hypothetical protein
VPSYYLHEYLKDNISDHDWKTKREGATLRMRQLRERQEAARDVSGQFGDASRDASRDTTPDPAEPAATERGGERTARLAGRKGRSWNGTAMAPDQAAAFEAFWSAYRQHKYEPQETVDDLEDRPYDDTVEQEDRRFAILAWRKLDPTPELATRIIRAAHDLVPPDNPDYMTKGSHWLRDQRWEDE